MEQIKDTIGIDSHRSADGRRVGLEAASRMNQLANRRWRHGLIITIDSRLASSATNPLGNIDASLCGIAGLARIDDILSSDVGRATRVASQSLRVRAIGAIAKIMSTGFRRGSIAFFARSIAR